MSARKRFHPEMLIPIIHLKREEQQARLQCSRTTIDRLRAELVAQGHDLTPHREANLARGRARNHPRFTLAQLERVRGLSIPAQAAALQCSYATIKKLRRQLREAS